MSELPPSHPRVAELFLSQPRTLPQFPTSSLRSSLERSSSLNLSLDRKVLSVQAWSHRAPSVLAWNWNCRVPCIQISSLEPPSLHYLSLAELPQSQPRATNLFPSQHGIAKFLLSQHRPTKLPPSQTGASRDGGSLVGLCWDRGNSTTPC